jgi:hypothetical protein
VDDELARRLAALPVPASHPGLEGLEGRVLGDIARGAERRIAVRVAGLAAAGALMIGFASTSLVESRDAPDMLDPLADAAALAPSALLLDRL